MPPAARVTDMHVCPMVTAIVPHVGGPIIPPGQPTVLIDFLPAATVTNMLTCVGPPDMIVMGSIGVMICFLPAARHCAWRGDCAGVLYMHHWRGWHTVTGCRRFGRRHGWIGRKRRTLVAYAPKQNLCNELYGVVASQTFSRDGETYCRTGL
jgi:uncharacterized Zn-binding protein involved in type VI secretion